MLIGEWRYAHTSLERRLLYDLISGRCFSLISSHVIISPSSGLRTGPGPSRVWLVVSAPQPQRCHLSSSSSVFEEEGPEE